MTKTIDKKIRQVHRRCTVNVLLKQAGIVLFVAGIMAMLAVLAQKLLALDIINQSYTRLLYGFAGATFIAVFVLWYLRKPSRMQVSLLLDERMKLKERFSTTLAFNDSHTPFADAARNEATTKINNLYVKGHFPIQLSNGWAFTAGIWLIVYLLVLFLPQKDLLGFLHKRNQQQQLIQQTQQAKVDVNNVTKAVALAVRNLAEPNLAQAVSKLDQMPQDARPEDIKRQAIRQLGDLSDQIKNLQNIAQADSLKMMQQMFQQLRGSPEEFTQKMQLALAKGDFSQASAILKQMQKELSEGNLSEQQKNDMASQLQNLAKKLGELAQKSEELEKELQKQGLDKALAKLDENQLRQSLQQQGLPEDKIEQLLNKAAASRLARNQMSALASAMAGNGGGEGGLTSDELSEVMDQLDQLDAIQRQINLTEASLAEIARCIACLGEGMGYGQGRQGQFSEGDTSRSGPGTGGPGIGWGPRDSEASGQTSNKSTRVESNSKQGPVIASWYIKDTQIKGQAVRDYSNVIQAGRDSASEAISENEIPRKYEDAIKKYFGRLEQVPAETTEPPGN